MERRYSDDELRRIFEDAAQREAQGQAVVRGQGGHTLAEMREIAREVGIDPAAVDRAAANLVASGTAVPSSHARRGFPRVLHEESVLPRSLTNAEMRIVALQAERVLGRRGSMRDAGDWVEWRDAKDRLYVGIVRGAGHTRIRVIGDYSRELLTGAGVIGVLALFSLPVVIGLGAVQGLAVGGLVAGATYGLLRSYWGWRSTAGRGQLQQLLDILQDAVRHT